MTKEKNVIQNNEFNLNQFIGNFRYGYDRSNDTFNNEVSKFEYYDFEKEVIKFIETNRFSIIKKSRQMYITTLLATYTAYKILNGNNVFYHSNKQELSKEFKSIVYGIINKFKLFSLTFNGEVEYNKNNVSELSLKNGGTLRCKTTREDSMKGYDIEEDDIIIVDEAAFAKNLNLFISSILPITSQNKKSKIILTSTPNGLNDFFELYTNLKQNPFKRMSVNYEDNPRQDNEWLENMKKILNYDKKSIKQEIYGEFISYEKETHDKKLDSIIQFRINEDLFSKMSRRLIQKDMNISSYLRELVSKDVNN